MAKMYGLARVGANVVLRYTTNGGAVANVLLAFRLGKRGEDGEKKTQWVEATLWGKKAESLTPFLKKGKQIGAHLDDVCAETYTNKDGTVRAKMVATLNDIEFVSDHQDPKLEPVASRPTVQDEPDIPF